MDQYQDCSHNINIYTPQSQYLYPPVSCLIKYCLGLYYFCVRSTYNIINYCYVKGTVSSCVWNETDHAFLLIWLESVPLLKDWVFHNFECVKDESVFFFRAKNNPWKITYSLAPLVLWWLYKQKSYKQKYFCLSCIWPYMSFLWYIFSQSHHPIAFEK